MADLNPELAEVLAVFERAEQLHSVLGVTTFSTGEVGRRLDPPCGLHWTAMRLRELKQAGLLASAPVQPDPIGARVVWWWLALRPAAGARVRPAAPMRTPSTLPLRLDLEEPA